MTLEEFKDSLQGDAPPAGCSDLLQAMWFDARGDWEKAHNIAQDIDNADGSRVHGYLHRKEGDEWNASYWYRRAGQPFPKVSLDEEWEQIVNELIGKSVIL